MNWYDSSSIAYQLLLRMADASVRTLVLAVMAGILTLFLRRSSAGQHAMWTLVVIGMLALPVLRPVVPAMHIYVLQRPAQGAMTTRSAAPLATNPGSVPVSPPSVRTEPPIFGIWWPVFAAIAYITGAVLFGTRLMVGVFLTRRLLRGARSIGSELWTYFDPNANDVEVGESNGVRVPVTIGLKRMWILLPAEWREWPVEKMKLVLAHELAHARRYDPVTSLVAAVNKCIFWFHPLAWWLERRLAVLAEHAADDAGLAASSDVESYARVVLEVASRMEGQNTRLIWNASAMNGQLVAGRIRRVLDPRTKRSGESLGNLNRALLLSSAAFLMWISIAVDLQSVARAQTTPPTAEIDGTEFGFISDGGRPDPTTPEQAAAMEQQLAANPEDEATRSRLLHYYWQNNMHDRRIPLVLWLIDHHPESTLHSWEFASIFSREPGGGNTGIFQDARSRWLAQVNLHPDDARVLGNAARALDDSVPEAIGLLKRAQKLDPKRRTEPLARLYSVLLVWSTETGTTRSNLKDARIAAQVRSELQNSNDIALVGPVARHVVEQAASQTLVGYGSWDFTALRTVAAELVTHAQALEPLNRDWADLMEGVKGFPTVSVQPPVAPVPQSASLAPQLVRIGAGVAASMLRESSTPIYPPEAKAAGVVGVVKLQVRIGRDGHVIETTLLSGHPLLVPAAMDAVKHYVYKPLTIEGKAVDVMTTVEVAFGPGGE
jgi:TonB family protein